MKIPLLYVTHGTDSSAVQVINRIGQLGGQTRVLYWRDAAPEPSIGVFTSPGTYASRHLAVSPTAKRTTPGVFERRGIVAPDWAISLLYQAALKPVKDGHFATSAQRQARVDEALRQMHRHFSLLINGEIEDLRVVKPNDAQGSVLTREARYSTFVG